MKKIRNIYEKIYDFENLYQAYLEARKCKRYRQDVLQFSANLEENLIQIQNELIYKTYKVGRYREFFVYDPKKRLIMALPFKDRVVQWAIYRQLNPILDKQYIYDSYGCRIGKGTHKAADRLQYWLRQVSRKPEKYYYLKLDISKYFYRVDHQVLMDIIKKKFDDPNLIWLMDKIINSEDTKFGLPLNMDPDKCTIEDRLAEVGMPIGNLTSQMFANLYLNELDQYVKHELKLHYYIRYMDDIIILHYDKKYLHAVKDDIEQFLNDNLKLQLNKKTAVRPISCGIEFVGFRIWPTHRKLKKKTALKMKHRLKYLQKAYKRGEIGFQEVNSSVQSYFGMLKHCNSYNLRRKLFNILIFSRS
ncbi:Retron-type reverse transcriptase [Thermoanaerobacter thermohydrosulfuricus WC1]|uniref:Retron-type reverse transcriptase n=1 Tax=Thermoanaerobacter thermohydrosulfuricus WC1 TaxID=1198630 RepID=M8DDA7_THETY|nr:RNA-dependent DNA polymerase [Thermoanaerobacter thermohydrosulfuricus]EMT38022.1 Retron-type reverse transcriptase [Thermoanaerobacter thermohydrosulfuricus WC1]